jgi:hypothetical protein
MAETTCSRAAPIVNRGICLKCNKVVPAHHEARDNSVYLIKECAECGPSEALLSTDAVRFYAKRDLLGYAGEAQNTCGLNCTTCNHGKKPTLAFLDVTNRCNMNCPICLANIPAMGFQFEPPMAYFEKIFQALARLDPKPKIQLFGGEPTVRDDIVEIINLAKSYGLQARVVTNGVRLVDEEFCKRLLATGTQLMFAFDGRDPEIYRRIRNSERSYELKLKALENVRKHRKSKITIMCCAGVGVNEDSLADLGQFCHDGRDYIAALDLIPLTLTWGPETVDAQNTTMEDVERMMSKAFPGLEFVPAGLLQKTGDILAAFRMNRVTFGGAHPNCESVSLLISDGEKYQAPAKYLKRSFPDVIRDAVALNEKVPEILKRSWIARSFGDTGKMVACALALWPLARRSLNFRAIFGGSALPATARIAWGLMRGKKMKDLLRANSRCQGILRVIILPFEESGCVESARLVECPTAFAYEHPVTGEVRLMPVCAWPIHKNQFLRAVAERYGVAGGEPSSVAAPAAAEFA